MGVLGSPSGKIGSILNGNSNNSLGGTPGGNPGGTPGGSPLGKIDTSGAKMSIIPNNHWNPIVFGVIGARNLAARGYNALVDETAQQAQGYMDRKVEGLTNPEGKAVPKGKTQDYPKPNAPQPTTPQPNAPRPNMSHLKRPNIKINKPKFK